MKKQRREKRNVLYSLLLLTALLALLLLCAAVGLARTGIPKQLPIVNIVSESVGMPPVPQDAGYAVSPASYQEQMNVLTIPGHYDQQIDRVTFNMDIVADAVRAEGRAFTAKARMQKVNFEKAFQLFFQAIGQYDTYMYDETNEYGEMVSSMTYVSPKETTLSYGPQSCQFEYMCRTLMPYVLNAFIPFQDERYNADQYSTQEQLTFMTREKAYQKIENALKEIDVEIETRFNGYALDHKKMQSQEYHTNFDGEIDRSQYKPQWSQADDCYYFCIHQTIHGTPLYHVYSNLFTDVSDSNAPIQAVVSEEGIEYLNIEKIFEIYDEESILALADLDTIAKTVANKYNQVLGTSSYEITKAELFYYVDLSSGMGEYDVRPVWILTGSENSSQGQKAVQIIIDAQTAEERLP